MRDIGIGRKCTYGEALDLVDQLQLDTGSHISAELSGWLFPASYGELMAGLHAQAYINVHRDVKKHPNPFAGWSPLPGDKSERADVTPEEREMLRQSLIARSAFPPDS